MVCMQHLAALAVFANQLNTAQRAAVSTIHVNASDYGFSIGGGFSRTAKLRISRLTGLKCLTLVLEDIFIYTLYSQDTLGTLATLYQEMFAATSLTSVDVQLRASGHDPRVGEDWAETTRKVVIDVANDIEQALLSSSSV